MTFEEYARAWLERQNFAQRRRKTARQGLEIYSFPVIGSLEIDKITEADIDKIFTSERLFNRKLDFLERTFRMLVRIFDELECPNPVRHIYSPDVLIIEKMILDAGKDVEITAQSPFVAVSYTWLKKQQYRPVTHNLYLHFLKAFIHPFIRKKPIGLVNQNNITNIYTYFNTVSTNETWIGQIHLVMRMVFGFAINNNLIKDNPMLKINDPHLTPILNLTREQKNAVRYAFNKNGFRRDRLKFLAKDLFRILHPGAEKIGAEKNEVNEANEANEANQANYVNRHNRRNLRRNRITFREVYEQWHENTQDGIMSEETALASFRSMDIYMLPNLGNKPIQDVSLTDLKTITEVYALMGNTADFYILAKLRSLYNFAVEKGYVSDNIAYSLHSANNKTARKLILSDEEIKRFFVICDEMNSAYGCLFATMLCTGIRIREALAITQSNIDRELRTLKIEKQISNGKLISTTKTRRGRKIRLSRTALEYIDRASSRSDLVATDLVFTMEDGRPLSYTNVNRKLDEIALKMHRSDITAHTLRHTYMTVSARCGENIDAIQNEVGHGHSSNVITEYLHQTKESQHEAALRRQEYLEQIMARYGYEVWR